MISITIPFVFLWISCTAEDYYYYPINVTRSTLSAIAAYRSALTLDWMAAEDSRQRELAAAFETEAAPPARVLASDCIAYARPSTGKVARLMLELLKNLEGDDAKLIPELLQVLLKAKLLVEPSLLDAEPDLESLVKTPGVMMGEPHVTFPRILAMLWIIVTDPSTTRKEGWCPVNSVNKYISVSKSMNIAKHMRALDPIIARARFIMEEFIQNVTPLNMFKSTVDTKPTRTTRLRLQQKLKTVKRPIRIYTTKKFLPPSPERLITTTATAQEPEDQDPILRAVEEKAFASNSATLKNFFKILLIGALFCFY